MRRLQLVQSVRCFQMADSNGPLLAKTNYSIPASNIVEIGELTTMTYNRRSVLVVPYQVHMGSGFLLYDEIKSSLDETWSSEFEDLLSTVCEKFRDDLLSLINTGDMREEYEGHLFSGCEKCETAINKAFHRSVANFEKLAQDLKSRTTTIPTAPNRSIREPGPV